MLFTTAVFAFVFLPVVLGGFFFLGRVGSGKAAAWLFLASLFFYGWWMPKFTLLLLGSICGNFYVATRIASMLDAAPPRRLPAKRLMVAGVVANLALLAYFKYANFFVSNLNTVLGTNWDIGRVLLPIGISFFTFTQLAFLADAYQKGAREGNFVRYGLFVTYFPHLIAGPVLHHAQMMPQFRVAATYRFDSSNFVGGLAILALGMLKKVVFADGISPYADAVFKPVDAGVWPDFEEAWLGALAYAFQIYFDFSGYSDMAIGLSWMFNIRLPFNFNSPYRALDISDFWRRWHMSLSSFLRDYLYIALGGNRKGALMRYFNLMTTMVLGGLWHGASWSFVVWGALHGAYLVANHGFRALCGPSLSARLDRSRAFAVCAWALTMLSVMVAWVFFRAETLAGAARMLRGMARFNPPADVHQLLWNAGLSLTTGMWWCIVLGAVACFAPNSNRLGTQLLESCRSRPAVRALTGGAASGALMFLVVLNAARDSISAFIYFNF
jgi:alginate O-acetyltransferase complex protein AlgI